MHCFLLERDYNYDVSYSVGCFTLLMLLLDCTSRLTLCLISMNICIVYVLVCPDTCTHMFTEIYVILYVEIL